MDSGSRLGGGVLATEEEVTLDSTKWTLDEEKLVNETVGERSEFVWSKLILVRETKKGFLLFPQPRLAHWIPRTAFKNEEEVDQLRTLVKGYNIPYKLA